MKILHVSLLTPYAGARSGAGVVIDGQFKVLKRDHDLTLVLLAPTNDSELRAQQQLRDEGINIHVLHDNIPRTLVRLKRMIQGSIGRARGWPAMGYPRKVDPMLMRLVDRLIDNGCFDLLQVENIGLPHVPTRRRIPTLLIEHEVRKRSSSPQGDSDDIQAALWAEADRVQVFTTRDAVEIARRAPGIGQRISVNPFGVDLPREPTVTNTHSALNKTITFIGNFRHAPNIDAAAWLCKEIVPRIRNQFTNVNVKLVGQDPPASIQSLASNHIDVTGRVPNIQPFLNDASVVAVPARAGGGMRVKTLQALASGRAVVSTRLGAEGLLGPASNWPLILADETDSFADAVIQLLDNPSEAENLGNRAREFINRHHTWHGYLERIERTYHELLSLETGGKA